ncbi:unnamed protein product, partial [Mesorhabditis belari]|uniref:Mitochondrial 2-oxoglutarate/malate carrier protein n=1 Tax=Mesorhabditis belari TaxID=2138241 RepID=A0AAF3J4D0_9BILA
MVGESQDKRSLPNGVKFVTGGLAGMGATTIVQPLDLVKNRMQLSGKTGQKEFRSSFHALSTILEKEGPLALYNGLSAGLLRQITYGATRLGVYSYLFERISGPSASNLSFAAKASIAMSAGAVGAFVGNPAELALIRMTSDGRLPVEQRRNYHNVFDALVRITKEEGPLALWRGSGPTMLRAMVVAVSQLATYSQAKQMLLESGTLQDGLSCHFVASMCSGLCATLASMPVDMAKTRMQSMRTINGVPEYRNAIDVWQRVIRNEGVLALWKGFTPYYFRLGPHTVLLFIFLEQLNSAYSRFVLGVETRRTI